MDKINFENLPSTNTPLSASNLNTMQSNIEKSVVAVGKTQPSTSENVWIKKGKNLFDKNKAIKGYELTFGALSPNLDWWVSDYILVDENTTYYKSGNITAGTAAAFYDENKNYISQVNVLKGSFITDTGVKYIRINGKISEIDNNIMIEQETSGTTYEPYIEKEILVKNNNGVFERFTDIDEIENSIYDTGWISIQFTSNDWKAREGSVVYAPKFRKIGNIVFLQGQFATKQSLNPGTYNIVTTNLPEPDKQHTICTCAYTGKLVNMWIAGKTISFRVFDNNFNDSIGVSIDSCYIAY